MAPLEIRQELDQLKARRAQLQKELEDVSAAIFLKESNLTQLPKAISEKKKEMMAKYKEAKTIRSKRKAIPGSAEEDNRLIAEVDAIRLNAFKIIQETLNL